MRGIASRRGIRHGCGGITRPSFTLIELLISVSVIALLAATALFTLYGALEAARESRTRAQVTRLHELMADKWNDYLARPVRLALPAGTQPTAAAQWRLNAVRELMRMELPERITDVYDPAVSGVPQPAAYKSYRRMVTARLGVPALAYPTGWYQDGQPNDGSVPSGVWSYTHQGSECLYLILSHMRDEDGRALDFFVPSEIGDTDGDGMLEVLDGWGRPIEFLRWAPGFATLPGPDGAWGVKDVDDDGNGTVDDDTEIGWPGSDDSTELQSRDPAMSPDPLDPLRVDTRETFALYPLFVSAGRDGAYGIEMSIDMDTSTPEQDFFHYNATPGWRNDPYYVNTAGYFGRPNLATAADNITNHSIEIQ